MKIRSLLPHSWLIEDWPREVVPGNADRGRYLVRMHRRELEAAGALSRVGRQLVVLGEPYSRWLQSRARHVAEFQPISPNRTRRPATEPTHAAA